MSQKWFLKKWTWQHCKHCHRKNTTWEDSSQTFRLHITTVCFLTTPKLFVHPAQTVSAILFTINLELLHTLNVWASDRHLKTMRIVTCVTSCSATQGARNNEKAQGFNSRCFEIWFCDALASLPDSTTICFKSVTAFYQTACHPFDYFIIWINYFSKLIRWVSLPMLYFYSDESECARGKHSDFYGACAAGQDHKLSNHLWWKCLCPSCSP